MEQSRMLSVGIDIGTSTTSVIFSHLFVENTAGYFSVPAVRIIDKKVFYRSPVYTTPLLDASLIDGKALAKIIESEYAGAGVAFSEVQTGAVIITGESARKENARMILEEMSGFAGDFVVSTAGPDLESVIAGQGSGAQRYSEENSAVVANLDIGGGTTNIVIFDSGEIVAKGCLDIGGRQVTLSDDGQVTYVSPSAEKIAAFFHIPIEVGAYASEEALDRLCDAMSAILEEIIGIGDRSALADAVRTKGSTDLALPAGRPVRHIFFSGGVAKCIYSPEHDRHAYGDIGVILAEAIRRSRFFTTYHVVQAEETIRATVIGAGTYTTSVSGSTITYREGLFPMKNVPVLALTEREESALWNGDAAFLEEKVRWFLKQNDSTQMVLAIKGRSDPDYTDLKRLAYDLATAMDRVLDPSVPLIVIVREDIAKALGQILRQILGGRRAVIAVDEIRVEQNNFVDFGNPIMNGLVIPVVVKTLIFG
ncbi:MAG: ethanolamine utilization protein EutA [Lachnospiraceae bacterium]|nr:ethanolamine utilization protein EutA [Lachnospiraceae bacterium]